MSEKYLFNKCLTFVLELFGFILEDFMGIWDPHIWDIFIGKYLDTLFLENQGHLGFLVMGKTNLKALK